MGHSCPWKSLSKSTDGGGRLDCGKKMIEINSWVSSLVGWWLGSPIPDELGRKMQKGAPWPDEWMGDIQDNIEKRRLQWGWGWVDEKYEFHFGHVDHRLLEGTIGSWFPTGLEGTQGWQRENFKCQDRESQLPGKDQWGHSQKMTR